MIKIFKKIPITVYLFIKGWRVNPSYTFAQFDSEGNFEIQIQMDDPNR